MRYETKRLVVLILIVFISGLSQGMLLPSLAYILDIMGISSTFNGLHAAGLYIGMLAAGPFMEPLLQKLGYKPMIVLGGLLVIVSLMLFPLWGALTFWFILRLLIGFGDSVLHFATQTWITDFTHAKNRGRTLSMYGLSFGIGFAFGPLVAETVKMNQSLPFMISSVLSLLAWVTIFTLKNESPTYETNKISLAMTMKRVVRVVKIAWLAVVTILLFGYMEASLNNNFPIFALRNNFEGQAFSFLFLFTISACIIQIPLGMWSDRFGRKRVLRIVLSIGTIAFLLLGVFHQNIVLIAILLAIAGGALGSLFSLSIAYMADQAPKELLPAGNLICGMAYSVGCIFGPAIGGAAIEKVSSQSLFYTIFFALLLVSLAYFLKKDHSVQRKAT